MFYFAKALLCCKLSVFGSHSAQFLHFRFDSAPIESSGSKLPFRPILRPALCGHPQAPSNSSLMLFEKVNFRATTPAPVIVRATFSWPICLLFLFSSSENSLKHVATDFFYSFPANSGDETKSGYVVKHLFLYVSKYLGRLTFELWNSVATFCR